MNAPQLDRLCEVENRIETLRQQLRVSARGEMIFQASRSMWSGTDVVVEADGRGAAKLLIVEGNYPSDYTTHREQSFPTEEAACEAAEQLVTPAESPTYRTAPE